MRAVIYARYSTDLQREASIEDQVRICRQRIDREGWTLVATYSDAASSAAPAGFGRATRSCSRMPGAAPSTWSWPRRSTGSPATRRTSPPSSSSSAFRGVRLVTLAEGEISELHVGLKGTMNALFLKDLAAKTHRGLRGPGPGGPVGRRALLRLRRRPRA